VTRRRPGPRLFPRPAGRVAHSRACDQAIIGDISD